MDAFKWEILILVSSKSKDRFVKQNSFLQFEIRLGNQKLPSVYTAESTATAMGFGSIFEFVSSI